MAMTDLFQNKSSQLEEFCKEKGYFSKADLMEYGLRNYYLRSDRTVREWVAEGKVKHLSKDECLLRGFKGKMAYYEWRK